MIPKKIHYIWLGGNALPPIAEKCIDSWKKFCPDYEIIRWDESNVNLDLCQYVREAYDAKKYAFASDVLRFDILNREGGIYLDIDVELLKPIDEFLEHDCFTGFEFKESVAPGLIFGTVPNGDDVKALLDMYENEKFLNEDGSVNLKTICERTIEYYGARGLKLNNELQKVSNTVIYPSEFFCPLSPITNRKKITQNTHAIHLYYSSWYNKKAKIKKNIKKTLNFLTCGVFGTILYKINKKKRKK